jgi:ankyrin repeat protein
MMPAVAGDRPDFKPELYQAIVKDDVSRAAAAINAGEDANAIYDRDTLLCWAIRNKRTEIAKLIIQSPKVDVNRRGVYYDDMDEWERTALILAAHMGQAEIVDLLLERGANINDRDSVNGAPQARGNTALIKAAQRDHLDVVRALFAHAKKPDVNIVGREGVAALWSAVENEDLEMVSFLHGKGARIGQTNIQGASVLTATIFHKKYDVLDFLVANGADINWADNGGLTTLMVAVGSGGGKNALTGYKFIEKFLTFKPKIDFQQAKNGGAGESALHFAALYGYVDIVKLLLDNGATINLVSLTKGGTPLHNAATGKRVEVVKFLLKRGAKTEIQDVSGLTPLTIAVVQNDPDTMQALIEGGATIDTRSSVNSLITPLVFAASNIDPFKHKNYLTIIRMLLDNKADVNYQAANGNTALIAAAGSSDLSQAYDKVSLLVDRGANLNTVNKRGETALMLATAAANEKVVKLLIDKGADTQLKNGAGESVMSYANRRNNKSVSSLLESSGVKQEAPVVKDKVVVGALLGTWQGSQDGLPQAVMTFVFNKDNTYDFVSRLKPEVLKQFPPGAINPVIATHKGSYTLDGDTLILYPTGIAPVSMKWKLVNAVLIIDDKTRMKKTK